MTNGEVPERWRAAVQALLDADAAEMRDGDKLAESGSARWKRAGQSGLLVCERHGGPLQVLPGKGELRGAAFSACAPHCLHGRWVQHLLVPAPRSHKGAAATCASRLKDRIEWLTDVGFAKLREGLGGPVLSNSTQRYLAITLMDMCAEKPLEKITVSELTKRAGVARPTFYNHFENMDELIFFAAFLPHCFMDDELPYEERMRWICQWSLRHKEFYVQIGDMGRFWSNWITGLSFLDEADERILRRISGGEDLEDVRSKCRYANTCAAGIYRLWWSEGLVAPADEIVEYLIAVRKAILPLSLQEKGLQRKPLLYSKDTSSGI